MRDEDWPHEVLFDTRTSEQRAGIAALLLPQIATCRADSFDAVELDDLDSYTRSAGLLTADDNLALATLLVDGAHAAGLAVGQKNAADLATCAVPGRPPRSMILRDRDLVPAGSAGYVYESC